MKAPRTYTREDVIEFNCHGGASPLKKILELTLAAGARLARPGEFSLRAFLNGRMDLVQAEAVIDIIRAKTENGLKLAASQLKGDLSKKIYVLQNNLLGLLAQVEANLDFPDEDLEERDQADLLRASGEIHGEIQALIKGAEAGKIYREGISTIIIGRPNVGKSSLLNALLRENRAIVTDIPGTTRDVIEETINIGGIPLKIIDTAGLHETEDRQAIFIINKADLAEKKINEKAVAAVASGRPLLWLSALEGTGLEQLEKIIFDNVMSGRVTGNDTFLVTNARHKQALEKASAHLEDALAGIGRKVSVDMAAIDIRAAWEALGEITGSTVTEDLLDRIFADFCIGK
jgi:tRNA modification GTPase